MAFFWKNGSSDLLPVRPKSEKTSFYGFIGKVSELLNWCAFLWVVFGLFFLYLYPVRLVHRISICKQSLYEVAWFLYFLWMSTIYFFLIRILILGRNFYYRWNDAVSMTLLSVCYVMLFYQIHLDTDVYVSLCVYMHVLVTVSRRPLHDKSDHSSSDVMSITYFSLSYSQLDLVCSS